MKPGVGGFMMLQSHGLIPMTDAERRVWEQVIPVDHYLRRLATAVDFERFRPLLEASYAGDFGRPPLDVVVMLKLELLELKLELAGELEKKEKKEEEEKGEEQGARKLNQTTER